VPDAVPVALVTDTTHYLPRQLVRAKNIHEVSLYVKFEGREVRESELLEDFDDFYEKLRTAQEMPTTSQPSIGDFLAVWEPLLNEGNDIVSVHLASGISGTYDSALQAKNRLVDDGLDEARLCVVDAKTGAGGAGMMLLAGASCVQSGGDVEAVANRIRSAREQLRIWFIVETLEYLRRGGRIGGAAALLGGALKIKPILTFEEEITPVERVRTFGARVRADGRLHALAQGGRRRRLGHPARAGARAGPSSWPSAAARCSAPTRCSCHRSDLSSAPTWDRG
jgi:DegV family protein with EDD domain